MKRVRSLNTRLVLSHLAVSIVSIILMAFFAGQAIFQAANSEAEHNLEGLAFAAGNALELPIQEYREGQIEVTFIRDMLNRMFSDTPNLHFTLFKLDGSPLVDSSDTLPPIATYENAPEVWDALDNEIGRGVATRPDAAGEQYIYVAVLVQREIEVTAILRLGVPLAPTQEAARRSLFVLILAAILVTSGVGLFGWLLANNLARPIQILRRAADDMANGDLDVRVKPSGPQELQRLAVAFNSMANRLQSNVNELRAFVANASHELRTPLTVVKLRAEALQDGALEDTDVAGRFLAEIETEVDRLVRMVNDLLDLSRMEAGMESNQRTILNLSTIAIDVFETFKMRAARTGVNLEMDIEPGLPSVTGNEDQLRRVFYNMLENGIKYTPDGGQVELLLRPGPEEDTIRVLVRDTGPGIASEHLPHVFERFYRADQTGTGRTKGSGLGLAIAKTIVESHGGEMGVSSQIDNGSTFWADLPAQS